MNIICFGDSITHAKRVPERDRWPTLLAFTLHQWRPDSYAVYNRGIGGNTSAQGLDRIHSDVIRWEPGVVLIQFGFNDANVLDWAQIPRVGLTEYRAKLTEIARVVNLHQAMPVFIINHTITSTGKKQGNGRTYSENFEPYQTALREVAAACESPIIDLPAMMTERDVDLNNFLIEDGLHVTPEGNHIYADMVATGLKKILRQYFPPQ